MRYDPALLDEIRARVRLSDLVGRSVPLARAGREFKALSPFNKEKTPSFYVNDEKRFFHCFSSGKHGDAFTWLEEVEGLSFPEAVERLAAEAGVALPDKDPEAAAKAERAKGLLDWTAAAQEFFAHELRRTAGREARAYLERRGLPEREWARFDLGYAPDGWSSLMDELIAKGAKPQDLLDAGLVAQSSQNDKRFDTFRDRVTFAIKDPRGRVIGFGGRAMKKDDKAKYLNSPEGPLFHKGATLYRYGEARQALAAAGKAGEPPRGLIVAEGYMDVIALAQAGFGHAVAPLGTALTEDQLDLLWRAGPEPILCFDGDAAGVRAAHRALDRALPHLQPGRTLRFALMPPGKDPDDLIRGDGRKAMAEVLSSATPLVEMLWSRELAVEPTATPEARAGLKRRLFTAAASIKDETLAGEYKSALLDRYDAAFRRARPAWKPFKPGERRQAPPAMPTAELKARARGLAGSASRRDADRLLRALSLRGDALDLVTETLAELDFPWEALARAQALLLEAADTPAVAPDLADKVAAMIDEEGGEPYRDKAGVERMARGDDAEAFAKLWISEAGQWAVRSAKRDEARAFADAAKEGARSGDREEMMRFVSAARRLGAQGRETDEDGPPMVTASEEGDADLLAAALRKVDDALSRKRKRRR